MPRLSKFGAAALAAFGWTSGGAASVTASYLVVAGGAGGGGARGAGGGAGGFRTGTTSLTPTLSYTVIVGAGGGGGPAGLTSSAATISNGNDSTFSSITSTGGGGGATPNASSSAKDGASGGSGGGGTSDTVSGVPQGAGGAGNTPSTSPSQGNNGGASSTSGSPNYGSGGGGGASAVGGTGTATTGGNGGAGTASSISGSSVTYAGGGGGATFNGGTAGTGGSGGGGAGSNTGSTAGTSGTANLGGGGGAGGETSGGTYSAGGNGGSGIVIISYAGAQQFGGGVVTSSGGNTIHTFNTSGTLSPISSLSASYLIVAGGGGGGRVQAGGGGAGGLLSGSGITIDTNSTYLVTVGSGGAGSTTTASGVNGTNSAFSMVTTAAIGGGGGASSNYPFATAGSSGGSGAGGSNGAGNGNISGAGGAGTSGQGNAGGYGWVAVGNAYGSGGGGGGAGAVGADAASGQAGAGGVGVASSISGTSTYYAGGGGGGGDSRGSTAGAGGNGGGGAGGNVDGVSGTANTGGGGGGGSYNAGNGGSGGSGIVIISYAGSTQQMAGGSVTITGGNVIHTFTSSGYLTPLKFATNGLRFRSSASAYLSRTPPVAGNRKTFTYSTWVKRGSLGTSLGLMSCSVGANNAKNEWGFSSDALFFEVWVSGTSYSLTTSAVYRDPAAWYHIVLAVDTTQATAANRIKIYVNGVQVTSFSSASYPPQNSDNYINSANNTTIGQANVLASALYFDGYLSEVNFIDGQQLTPNSFGSSNSYGVWQPITYGGSYGTNGFYLPFIQNTSSTYAGSFNGSNQTLQIANSGVFNAPATQNFTVEGWFYFNSFANPSSNLWGCSNGSGATAKMNGYTDNTNNVHFDFTTGGGASVVTSTTTLTAKRWYHIAWVRSSNVFTVYINGVASGSSSSTVNLTGLTQPFYIGYVGESYGSTFDGYMSNFRYVLGTAVYTSNFTPPTSPLTNVSGTVLLTLQNSTVIDNSSNAFSITNNNSVATSVQYPLMLSTPFNDQGPQGNNWVPNNISTIVGSTYDSMTDVPTLTSATAANYAVANPLNKQTDINSTNGNLSISLGTVTGAIRKINATIGLPITGKFYWESLNTGTTNFNMFCGIQTYTASLTSIGTNDIFYNEAGEIQNNGVSSGTIYGTLTSGDTLGIAYDADNNKIYFYKNGTLQNTGGTTPSFAGPFIPFFGMFLTNNGQAINFGQQPFKYTVPSGFVALNTFNM